MNDSQISPMLYRHGVCGVFATWTYIAAPFVCDLTVPPVDGRRVEFDKTALRNAATMEIPLTLRIRG